MFRAILLYKLMKTLEFQVRTYSVKNIWLHVNIYAYTKKNNKNIGHSHKYCNALACKKKGLRLKRKY